jgi:hypothetical protein
VRQTQPPTLSSAAFPELPTAHPKAKPPVSGNASLRHILGDVAGPPATSVWRASGNGHSGGRGRGRGRGRVVVGAGAGGEVGVETPMRTAVQEQTEGKGGRGKGKGKQKQTLFTLGSFPT